MPNLTKLEDIMTKGVFTVSLYDTVNDADRIMREEKVRHVPVLDGNKFIGLITERTLNEYTLRQIYDFDDNVEDSGKNKIFDFQQVMAKDVHVVYPEDSVKKAVELMVKKKIDCLPVVDWDNNLLGILTIYDILLFLNKKLT
jgi:CBS domain-containing membrane protein